MHVTNRAIYQLSKTLPFQLQLVIFNKRNISEVLCILIERVPWLIFLYELLYMSSWNHLLKCPERDRWLRTFLWSQNWPNLPIHIAMISTKHTCKDNPIKLDIIGKKPMNFGISVHSSSAGMALQLLNCRLCQHQFRSHVAFKKSDPQENSWYWGPRKYSLKI